MVTHDNFWKEQKYPLCSLAPMEDVTDTSFREMVMRMSEKGALNILYTEFTSTDGLVHQKGSLKVAERIQVSTSERALLKALDIKIVAQIWGSNADNFARSAELISKLGVFDGIDINMGCPVKKIMKGGSCSALILNPPKAKEIIRATKSATDLPVSVKTRTGFHRRDTESWIGELLETEPAAIILHARTTKEQSLVPADWNEVAIAVKLRNRSGLNIPIMGNGDIESMAEGRHKCLDTGADGFMVGRGIFKNPWMFRNTHYEPSPNERLETMLKHAYLFCNTWESRKSFQILKRFFKIYVNGFPGAAVIRAKLMDCNSLEEADSVVKWARTQSDEVV